MCRELTKRHETVFRASLAEAASYYDVNEPKGECVLVIEGMSREAAEQEERGKWADMSIEDHMEYYLSQGLDRERGYEKDGKRSRVPKREIYNFLEKEKKQITDIRFLPDVRYFSVFHKYNFFV